MNTSHFLSGEAIMEFQNPTREQFKALFQLEDEGPFLMLNLLKFRSIAKYEDGKDNSTGQNISGREAFTLYSQAAEAVLKLHGGSQKWIGKTLATLIGPTEDNWDLAFLAYYPSLKSFTDMVKSDAYQKATKHRSAAVADSRLVVCKELSTGPSFAPLDWK
jgi:uncharacterized protein (DUF1330 family)